MKQPNIDKKEELESARAALAACPVAEIRVENAEEHGQQIKEALSVQHDKPFPQSLYPMISSDGETVDIGVYYLGHHNDKSFGAIPYLILGKSPDGEDIDHGRRPSIRSVCGSRGEVVDSIRAESYVFDPCR